MAILESPSACIAAEEGVIAKAVLMPGDPLRAKFVAEHYLENPVCFNTVRNMLGYTGTYKGRKLSVMGHGMGVPSAGLYAHELYNFYGVDTIIRIGSAGGIGEDVKVRDVVLAMGASTNSHFADQYRFPGQLCATADYGLLKDAAAAAERLGSGRTWARCSPPTSSITTIRRPTRLTGNSASWRWKWRRQAFIGRPNASASGRCPSSPSPTIFSPAKPCPPRSGRTPSTR